MYCTVSDILATLNGDTLIFCVIFSPEKVAPIVKEMLGHSLITNQTPKSGVKVRQVSGTTNLFCYFGVDDLVCC